MTELARISPVTIERRRATAAIEEALDAGGHLVTLVQKSLAR